MKKVIITGGLGYIGMELAKIYSGKSRNYDVTVIDNHFFSDRVSQLKRWGIKFKQIDILDDKNLKNEINDAGLIYHLAGITNVGTTKDDIDKNRDKKINSVGVKGTRNIIKYSSDTAKIIFPSTHVVFEGIAQPIKKITEKDIPNPILDYSKGKFQTEKDLVSSNKNYVILRLGSVYGKSFDSTRLNIMANLFSKITSLNGKINLYAGGEQLKSLVSVNDVVRCMEFVGENQEIKNDIFNCVSENLTVKEVAKICKKFNKDIELISTDDPVPNKGYGLSNKKIKNKGFKFLYSIEKSIEEMVYSWQDQKKFIGNEIVQTGKNNFVDDRGIISNYYFDDSINMIGYLESKKATIRGNHYHPIQTQQCLLISGSYISVTKDLLNKDSIVETRLIRKGDLSIIPPNVAHTMVFLEDSVLLNLVNGERDHENYGITHTISYNLVDKQLGKNLVNSYKTCCRVCGGEFVHYLSLGLSPLANNLNDSIKESNDLYPLDLTYCQTCSNSQLSVVVPPDKMFKKYLYLSSTSEQFRSHFKNIAGEIKNDLKLKNNSLVVDVGSNDGIFLGPIIDLGIKAVGVEPAKNVARIANSKNLTTIPAYFDKQTVQKIIKNFGKADVVTAFNVFAHNDGLKDMLNNIEDLLKSKGEFIFEIQYILRTLKDLTFDNIYHEHVNYWCFISLLKFFEDSNLKIYKVKEVETHGGSLRVYATKDMKKRLHKSVNEYIKMEKLNKLDKIETYFKFAKDVEKIKNNSLEKINKILSDNKKIVGYGAPAKATTILNYFGIDKDKFEFTVEDNKLKHNKYIPGTGIQIKSIEDVNKEEYEYVLVLAWNFFQSIEENNKNVFKNSKFIKLK